MMHSAPNRMGLGLRAPIPNFQRSLAQPSPGAGRPMLKAITLFVGSISPGISDSFLTSLFAACGPLRSFKRLQTPAGKPQVFGFAEFEELDVVSRALQLLDDRLWRAVIKETIGQSRPQNVENDEVAKMTSETLIGSLLAALTNPSALPVDQLAEDIVIPPHLQDLEEQNLPEEHHGLVLSEISLFRDGSAHGGRRLQVALPRQPGGGGVEGPPEPDGGRNREPEREQKQGRKRGREREREREGTREGNTTRLESCGLASEHVGFTKEPNA
ncbi:hypothetical protein FRC09_009275 [Ceratobasidium sp. 395]|nr:hypothetical protein FRC09_009275 [Ceratobasidium sp. 395]